MIGHQMRLGDLLLGQGLITPDHIRSALRSQVVYGGRIGTNLVEVGCINIDTLALALGEQHGVPAASARAFESVSSATLGVMPRQLCAKYGACPLHLDGRTLHLALLDPQDLDLVDQVGRELGLAIYPYAVPQLRLLYYLEMHYQLRRHNRFLRIATQPREKERRKVLRPVLGAGGRAAPAPRAPTSALATAETVLGRPAPGPTSRSSDEPQVVGIEEVTGSLSDPAPRALAGSTKSATPEEILERLAAAGDRGMVYQQLLRPLLPRTSLIVLFIKRGNMAVALGAWGSEVSAQEISSLVVPLGIPSSLLQQAMTSRNPVLGQAEQDPLQQMIATFLRGPRPGETCAASVWLDDAPVNLLCVQSATSFGAAAAETMSRITHAASRAFRRLMQRELGTGDEVDHTPTATASSLWAGPDSWAGPGRAKPLGLSQGSGHQFGRYRVICRFASGGMANLYLARLVGPDSFEKLVALKKIHDHLSQQIEFIKRFGDEARLAARISHPNVVSVIEFGCVNGSHFIAMEYVDGESLAALLNQTRIPFPLGARIIAQAAAGLHAAHDLRDVKGRLLQVVHRDVSPHNLLIGYEGSVKVVDFGVAHARSNLHTSFVGTIAGKLAYMAPEQARGAALDQRVDIFALGIILHEMTTQRRLFKLETDVATLDRVMNGTIEPPSRLVPGYPPALEKIVMRALERQPERRFQTARQMQEALEQYIIETGTPVFESSLAQLMQKVFANRIQQKKLMLHQLLKQ